MNESKKSATKSTLLKQTKAELVNIILRKDSVEREKQAVIDELHKKAVTRVEYETLKDSYLAAKKDAQTFEDNYDKLDLRNRELNKLNVELQEALDEDASLIQELKNKYKFWRDFAVAFVLLTIGFVVLKVIM